MEAFSPSDKLFEHCCLFLGVHSSTKPDMTVGHKTSYTVNVKVCNRLIKYFLQAAVNGAAVKDSKVFVSLGYFLTVDITEQQLVF